ncbi:hypothetical protein MIND_00225600 [Mycena indigotica]|uniref:ADP-ribosylhydrolase ARH3 n=1 Tax=Mycena indigotica TaxID=2126181 RepID=A0A8H6T8Y0_9AGAR|nr:uncharacterized protein MIND_00225600 [Mycena indigotica]KAF7312132.1 hypothetical protein MIND_00225600 [Mycena indigotica]
MKPLNSQLVTPGPASTKIRLSLLSSAICDALGGPAEFHRRFSFDFVSEMIPNQNFGLGAGIWTDDTSMTLALAKSLATSNGCDEVDQLHRYYRWWKKGELSAIDRCFDIGNTICTALNSYHDALTSNSQHGFMQKAGRMLSSRAQHAHEREAATKALAGIQQGLSATVFGGNGSLMRILPVGLAYYRLSPDEVKNFAARTSRVTHPNEVCIEACVVWAQMIAKIVHSAQESIPLTKLDVLNHFSNYAYETQPLRAALAAEKPCSDEESYLRFHPILKLAVETISSNTPSEDLSAQILALLPQEAALRSSGYVVHTITAALYAFLVTETFEQGAMLVVNMGDDADTVAAVYGGLAGAWYGEDKGTFWTERVERWFKELVRKETIEEVANQLVVFSNAA